VMGMNITQTIVLNGDKAWVSGGDMKRELDGEMVKNLKESLYAERVNTLVPLLEDKSLKLVPLAEAKVDGRPALGVKVTSPGHRDLSLYFDKESGLLVKTAAKVFDPMSMQEVDQERHLSGHKDVGGIKRATKVVALRNGEKFMELEILE